MLVTIYTHSPRFKELFDWCEDNSLKYQVSSEYVHLVGKGFTWLPTMRINEKYLNAVEAVDFIRGYENEGGKEEW